MTDGIVMFTLKANASPLHNPELSERWVGVGRDQEGDPLSPLATVPLDGGGQLRNPLLSLLIAGFGDFSNR